MEKYSELVEIKGHIIDSLTFPKILDEILDHGGNYQTEEISIGKTKKDQSYARIKIFAPSKTILENILARILKLGAMPIEETEAKLKDAEQDGIFPDDFHITTNLSTKVRISGKWLTVQNICMDSGIAVTPDLKKAYCIKMNDLKKGDKIVVGYEGVKVSPETRVKHRGIFEFMGSSISPEKSKWLMIKNLAEGMKNIKNKREGKILFVCGPAVIHTGARKHLEMLINEGYVDVLFSGNGFATHDIEASLFGTSLGVSIKEGIQTKKGHEHHIRTINTIRKAGGIKQAVKQGILREGILHSCIKNNVDLVLTGSIRDDGPLPEVITDMKEAQTAMREKIKGVVLSIMIASMLHSIAVGNILPASVTTVCVDMNPEVVTKLSDRGSFHAIGLVTDAELFLRELTNYLFQM
ncbi:MAG: TIGR00300 family protein [Candidatus Schekmanbacteria bacterium GWA2_38_11]|uniref:ornithine cyclodeaminase n=1 Tax=Candidatus Schekmanbacteria bacterium GWA2_38_11 TaxID=1817876 RepID=A0A1F7RH01_9BACT|nr:MAG: TIGR00300 family protein [Candidatus Schekmanbacteria bacterium GWA2_38_11]